MVAFHNRQWFGHWIGTAALLAALVVIILITLWVLNEPAY